MHRVLAACLLVLVPGCLRSGSNRERHHFDGPFAQVVVNSRHTCLLDLAGSVRCFGGDDSRNPPMTPIPKRAYRKLASARRTVCGIRDADQQIDCFGSCIGEDVCSPPPGSFDDLALHDDGGGCAWDSTTTRCWGDERFSSFVAPPPELLLEPVRNIVFGPDWSLIHYVAGNIAIHSAGRPSDERGVWNDPLLVELAESGELVAGIAGKGATACVIDSAGTPRCVAYYGGHAPEPASHVIALGFSAPMGTMPACSLAAKTTGERVGSLACTPNVLGVHLSLPGHDYTQIAVGDHHVCALERGGDVECIGSDRTGAVTGRRDWPTQAD